MCRIDKASQGSAVFDEVSEEQVTGRVVDRMIPPGATPLLPPVASSPLKLLGPSSSCRLGLQTCRWVWLAGCLSVCLSVCHSARLFVRPNLT